MLLSRVAESIYWVGRYLERAEAGARLAQVHTELYCDLPLSASVGWSPLLAVTGSADAFGDRHHSEDDIVAFLAIDTDNPGSVLASLASARENLRVTRDQFPREAWEELNDLFLWACDRTDEAVARRSRRKWCTKVIRRSQLLTGLLTDTMSHNDAYAFLNVGRFIERADMTTRVLDVQAGILFGSDSVAVQPYADVTWTSVLTTLSAQQMFQRSTGAGVSGPAALRFLLTDAQFPRSVEHCLTGVSRALIELPSYDAPMASCAEAQELLEDVDFAALDPRALHVFVDDMQASLAGLHDVLLDTYFRVTAVADEATLPVPA